MLGIQTATEVTFLGLQFFAVMQAVHMYNKISFKSQEVTQQSTHTRQTGIPKKKKGLKEAHTCRGVNITKRVVYVDL